MRRPQKKKSHNASTRRRTISLTEVAAPEVRRSKLINVWWVVQQSIPAVLPARACRLHSGNSPGRRSPDLKHCRPSAEAHPPAHTIAIPAPCAAQRPNPSSHGPAGSTAATPPRTAFHSPKHTLLPAKNCHHAHTHAPLALHRAQMRGSTRR